MIRLTTRTYILAACVIAAAAIAHAAWSWARLAGIERRARDAAAAAAGETRRAERLAAETHIYRERTAHLERQVAEMQAQREERDEELKKLAADTDRARRALGRARGGTDR